MQHDSTDRDAAGAATPDPTTHSVELTFPSAVTLSGTLRTPRGNGPAPAALLVSGSGPIDRNSDTRKLAIGVMGQLAEQLGQHGIGSLRYDKRGIGASGGQYLTTGFHDNVADAAAALRALRARPEVDPARVMVIGHSEGALIATELAAADPTLAGVVLLAAPAQPGADVLRWQARQVAASLPTPVKLLLRLLRRDVVRSQAKALDRLRRTTTDSARIQLVKVNAKWFREFVDHDPAPSLRRIRVPVLAVTGSKDIQVDPADVARICQLVPGDCTGRVLDDITHLLRREPGPPSVRTYRKQARRPIDPAVTDLAIQWATVKLGAAPSSPPATTDDLPAHTVGDQG